MRRLLLLLVLVGLLVAAFYYLRGGGTVPNPPNMPALGTVKDEVKEKLGQVGDKLRETKTQGSVKAALELNRELQPYSFDIDVDAANVVTLKGEVPRDDLRSLAGQIAGAVPDVARVDNQVRTNPQMAPPAPSDGRTVGENLDDKALEAKVNLAFSLNKDLKGTDLKVSAFRRAVTLSGQVATPAQKQLAVSIAQQTTGVQGVTDQVATGGAGTPPPVAATDPVSRATAAQTALRSNSSLSAYALSAVAEGGKVVVKGAVQTAAEKDLAGLVAKDAAGVPVENQIQFPLPTR
jgi:osmotically-inducible protein OsmY